MSFENFSFFVFKNKKPFSIFYCQCYFWFFCFGKQETLQKQLLNKTLLSDLLIITYIFKSR